MKNKTICPCIFCTSGKCGLCLHPEVATFLVVEHGLIQSEKDFLKLDIVDWDRPNSAWDNTSEALHTLASWFKDHAHYTIIETDLREAPDRSDFPGWDHVGDHPHYGQLYWNWFHHNQYGELHFSDSPDFYGKIHGKSFWGDIGKVSASALAHSQKQMQKGDIWISVLTETRQVIIEPAISIFDVWGDSLDAKLAGMAHP